MVRVQEEEGGEAEAAVGVDAVRHALFGIAAPGVLRAWVAACLELLDVPVACVHGLQHTALFPAADLRRDHLTPLEAELLTGADLGAVLGLPIAPCAGVAAAPAAVEGEDRAALPAWMPTASYESGCGADAERTTSGDGASTSSAPAPAPWCVPVPQTGGAAHTRPGEALSVLLLRRFAASRKRHAVLRSMVALLAASSSLKGEPFLTRALFAIEASPLLSGADGGAEAGTAEAPAAAAERARCAAKQTLSREGAAKDAVMWSGYAALEARCGRRKAALHALTATMGGLAALGAGQAQHRWLLALQSVLLELDGAGLRLGFSGAGAAVTAPDTASLERSHPRAPLLLLARVRSGVPSGWFVPAADAQTRVAGPTCPALAGHAKQQAALERAFHALLWAANGLSTAFAPLKRPVGTEPPASWPDAALSSARVSYGGAVSAAVVAARRAGGESASAGGDEAEFFAIACALLFEVIGCACGALPRGGWDRALRLFHHVMVRVVDCPDRAARLSNAHAP